VGIYNTNNLLQDTFGNRRTTANSNQCLYHNKQSRLVRICAQYRQDGISKCHLSCYSCRTYVHSMSILIIVYFFFFFLPDRPNWQDWGGRWARRTTFMRHLKTILEDLDVQYTMPIQPVLLPYSDASIPPNQSPVYKNMFS